MPKRTQRCFNLLINCPDIDLNAKNSEASGERTGFIVACAIGHKDVVKLMLDNSNSNIDLNARDNFGCTVFMSACQEGHKDVVQLMLDHSNSNIDLNARDNEGGTAYLGACSEGHKDVVQLMLDHSNSNIDLNARDNEGGTYCIYDGLSRRRY